MRRLGLVVSLGLVAALVLPVAFEGAALGAPGVILDDYKIKISPSRENEEITAIAEFDVITNSESGTDSLCLFLHSELEVDSVSDARRERLEFTQTKVSCPLSYSLAANRICLRLAERLSKGDTLGLVVSYHGKFTASPLRRASDFMRLDSDGLFLRGPGWSLWFPTATATAEAISAHASMTVEVVAPPGWKALCEGEPSVNRDAGLWSFKWEARDKIPAASAVLIASNYDTLSARVGGQKLSCWYFSSAEDSSASVKLFEASKELLGFFVQNYGDPLGPASPPRFTMVEMPIYGDFFSGTIMGISKGRMRETISSQKRAELTSLIASEMVRKFTVPAVDSSAPGAPFLLESVPSYAYVPAIERIFGRPFVWESSELVMRRYVAGRKKAESREAGFLAEKPLAELSMSDVGRYKDAFLLEGRGAYVLHMLRKLIGDESFYLAIRSYMAAFAERPAGARAVSGTVVGDNAPPGKVGRPAPKRARLEDFVQIAEAASGKRLDWFFSQWLYGDALPDYRIADVRVSVSRDTTFVDLKVENIGTGLMPVPVALFTDKGQRTSEVWLAAHESAQMRFVSRSRPKRVEIDPEKWILQADISNDGVDISPPKPSGS
ncbi:MAG: hypothetical protein NTX17_08390 [Candidatus Eisenbacteria bacterium]|nr:hypothetical protein [Candidatus Eisenbacteria bacterium]